MARSATEQALHTQMHIFLEILHKVGLLPALGLAGKKTLYTVIEKIFYYIHQNRSVEYFWFVNFVYCA